MSDAIPNGSVPRHVAVIMDGNGRWAQKRHLGRVRGHREGIAAVRTIVSEAIRAEVRYLTLFTFSSENWGRPPVEVKALMGLLAANLTREIADLAKRGVRVRVIGDRSKLPRQPLEAIEKAEAQTAHCDRLTLVLAISYGGRDEILNAVKKLVTLGVAPDQIDERLFRQQFYAPDIPDPDLLIRTSGEWRLSNFLLWQLAYTELYVTEVLWPDFGAEDFRRALEDYASRKRRFGLVEGQAAGNG